MTYKAYIVIFILLSSIPSLYSGQNNIPEQNTPDEFHLKAKNGQKCIQEHIEQEGYKLTEQLRSMIAQDVNLQILSSILPYTVHLHIVAFKSSTTFSLMVFLSHGLTTSQAHCVNTKDLTIQVRRNFIYNIINLKNIVNTDKILYVDDAITQFRKDLFLKIKDLCVENIDVQYAFSSESEEKTYIFVNPIINF